MSRDKPASERMPLCPVCGHRHPGVMHIWKSGALVPQKPKPKGKRR